MSHWKTFKNDALTNTNTSLLGKALKELGVDLDTNIKSIRNTWGHEEVDMGFKINGNPIALGFKQVGDKLELRGDFYGTGLREHDFMDKVSQLYTREDIVNKINTQTQYTIDSMTTNQNGEIEILAYCYA